MLDLPGEFFLALRVYRLTEKSPCVPEFPLKRWNPLPLIPWLFQQRPWQVS
jgi:hypothetical protein